MQLPRNATSVVGSPTAHFLIHDNRPQTQLCDALSGARHSPEVLHIDFGALPNASRLNADFPPPVLVCPEFIDSYGDFVNQAALEREWSALKEHLRTTTLSEQEVLEVLSSGILQTETGKAIAGLFVDAMLRSIRPVGELTTSRLQEIVDVLCHLPPRQWQAALGENTRFLSGQGTEGVTGYIQSHLNRSYAQRDERIANDELVPDAQWEAIKQIAKQARSYIRPSDSKLDGKLMMLEDMRAVRPTLHDAHKVLSEFIRELKNPTDEMRKRWHPRFPEAVEAVLAQIKPIEVTEQTWLEWVVGPSWLGSFSEGLGTFLSMLNDSKVDDARPSADRGPTLLSHLQTIERNADFFSSITTTGPRMPKGLVGKLLYVCNVLDTFGTLKLDNRHILTSRPNSGPSNQAWKNGASELPARPLAPVPEQPEVAAQRIMTPASLAQFAAQVDDVLSRIARNMMPWDSAYADDIDEVRLFLTEDAAVYQSTTAPLIVSASSTPGNHLPNMEVIKAQLQSWLGRMSGTLIGTGVAVMSRTGDLIERNPGKTAGVFAAYMAISNFYANWFLPEPETMTDPLAGQAPDAFDMPDEDLLILENTLDGVTDLFDDMPDFAKMVKQRIDQSDYLDPLDDPQLIDDLEALLQQPVPGDQNVIYQDYLDEIIQLAEVDALDELDDDGVADSTARGTTIPDTSLATNSSNGARQKRSLEGGPSTVSQTPARVSSVHLLIEARLRAAEAEIVVQPGKLVAPGVTVEQAAEMFEAAFMDLQTISDPSFFMRSIIENAIDNSQLPKKIKSTLDCNTIFTVGYKSLGTLWDEAGYLDVTYRHESFNLIQLFSGRHKKARRSREEVSIHWPGGYTQDFKATVEGNDFEKLYGAKVKNVLSQPAAKELWIRDKKSEVHRLVAEYEKNENTSSLNRKVAREFLSGNMKASDVRIRNGAMSGFERCSNVIHLANRGTPGFFVFLGGNGTVIEYPEDLFNRKKSIEEFSDLRTRLSDRISIFERGSRDDSDFKYSNGRFEVGFAPSLFFPILKSQISAPYAPIMFVAESWTGQDIYETLFETMLKQAESDIDTLTSTSDERLWDLLLEFSSNTLAAISLLIAPLPGPGAVVKGLSMLFGLASSGTDWARGELEDDPDIAYQHKANALRGALFEFAGPVIGKALGVAIPKGVGNQIAAATMRRFKSSKFLAHKLRERLPAFKGPSYQLLRTVQKVKKWIPPIVRDFAIIEQKFEKNFKSHNVIKKLNRLGKGPQKAQKLMDQTGVSYFASPEKGYVYRGFVMRGDMRPPQDVFKSGFELRTPITDIKQVNGFNGGFGGGKNALDPDGMGISTSPFYKDGGAGAYQYGGGRGGYTYVVDGRGIDGFDLYKNSNWKSNPKSKLNTKPYEINYGESIPPSKVLGLTIPTVFSSRTPMLLNAASHRVFLPGGKTFQFPESYFLISKSAKPLPSNPPDTHLPWHQRCGYACKRRLQEHSHASVAAVLQGDPTPWTGGGVVRP